MKVVKIGAKFNMLRLENGTETSWYKINSSNTKCLEQAKDLKVGDEIKVDYAVTTGVKVIESFNKVNSVLVENQEKDISPAREETAVDTNVGNKNNFSQPEKPQEFKCDTCGTSMKDGKYKTCYTCNMAKRAKTGGSIKSPEVQDSIKRQAIGHMTSRTLIGLQGSEAVNKNNLLDTMEKVYRKYQQLVG